MYFTAFTASRAWTRTMEFSAISQSFPMKEKCGEIREKQSEFIVLVLFVLLEDIMFAARPGHNTEQSSVSVMMSDG